MQDRTSSEYQQWRQDVRRRDGNACRRCGFNTNLEVHHIKPLVKYPEFAAELSNGLTLCGNCHSLLKGKEETTDLLKFIKESPYSRNEQIVGHLLARIVEQLKALNDKFAELTRSQAEVPQENGDFTEPGHIQAEVLRLEAEEKLKEAEKLRREADKTVKKRQWESEQKRPREAAEKRQRKIEEKHQRGAEKKRRHESEQKRQREAEKQQRRKAKKKLSTTKQQTSIRDLSDHRAGTQVKKKKNLGKPKNTHRKHLTRTNNAGTMQRTSVRGRWPFRGEVGRNRSKAAKQRRAKKLDRKQGPIALKQLELRAKKGDAVAQYNLGWRYEYGEGVVQDKREAAKWYRKAAERGHPAAQNKLTK